MCIAMLQASHLCGLQRVIASILSQLQVLLHHTFPGSITPMIFTKALQNLQFVSLILLSVLEIIATYTYLPC
jgi:hypothetical protein